MQTKEPEITIDLGYRLFQLRDQQGWSIKELARRAGISRTTLSNLERNKGQIPTLATLRRIAGAFGISVELMTREKPFILGRKKENVTTTSL